METSTKITTATIEAMYDNNEWSGFGYLGERQRNSHKVELVKQADALLIEHATKEGWTEEELFWFCNSRSGRRYGDLAFGSGDHYSAEELRFDTKRCAPIHKVAR